MRQPFIRKCRGIVIAVFLFCFLLSCDKKNDLVLFEHIVNIKQIKKYSSEQIKTFLLLARLQYPEIDSIIPPKGRSVKIYKLSYRTTFNGEQVTASGLVSLPDSAASYPIISFHNGTNTCHKNAPTENYSGQLYKLISMMAAHGYIISIPDYLGFGDSNAIMHPYMHRESMEQVVSDMLLAVKEFVNIPVVGANTNGDLYLMGYSQGGWTSLCMLNRLEKMPIDGLKPRAAACGAGAYNLSFMGKYILQQEKYPTNFYMPYFVESRIHNGIIEGDLSRFFKEPFASKIPSWFDGLYCNSDINELFPEKVSLIMRRNMLKNYGISMIYDVLRNELDLNSVDPWLMSAPVRFYHSRGDKSVPPIQSQMMYDSLLAMGVPLSQVQLVYHPTDTLDHNEVIVAWGVDALSWIRSIRETPDMVTEKLPD